MRKFIYSLVIPAIIGVIIAFIVLKQFPALLSLQQLQTSNPVSYASAVAKAAPAVVNIYTTTLVKQDETNPVLRQFQEFGVIPPKQKLQPSLGSGVIVNADGHLLTNYHVIANATQIVVVLRDGRESKASIVGIDPDTDLAVLKIDLPNLPVITLASSDEVRVGDVALAIGNPLGVGQTVTMGIISATGRHELGLNTYEDFIQTDAAINHGNSGGALIDTNGNLIGINAALMSGDSQQADSVLNNGAQGIGFAISSKLASSVLQEIIIHGEVIRGWLGLSVVSVTQKQLAQRGVRISQDALLITDLVANGPAAQAGLLPGDLILAVDNQPAENGRAIMNLIAQTSPGSKVILSVLRNQQTANIPITVAKKPLAVKQP